MIGSYNIMPEIEDQNGMNAQGMDDDDMMDKNMVSNYNDGKTKNTVSLFEKKN